jgi:hypothetical protein
MSALNRRDIEKTPTAFAIIKWSHARHVSDRTAANNEINTEPSSHT